MKGDQFFYKKYHKRLMVLSISDVFQSMEIILFTAQIALSLSSGSLFNLAFKYFKHNTTRVLTTSGDEMLQAHGVHFPPKTWNQSSSPCASIDKAGKSVSIYTPSPAKRKHFLSLYQYCQFKFRTEGVHLTYSIVDLCLLFSH